MAAPVENFPATKIIPVKPSLAEQRQALQLQLQAQRKHIEYQLLFNATPNPQYPRSMTMRFLSGRLGTRLITELAISILGPKYSRPISLAGTLFRTFLGRDAKQHS